MISKATVEQERIRASLHGDSVGRLVDQTYGRFEELLEVSDDRWKHELPGKVIFAQFCAAAGLEQRQLRNLYLSEAERAPQNPFQEIVDIFAEFAEA